MERQGIKVTFENVERLKALPCVVRVVEKPRLEVHVMTETSPEYPVRAKWGDTVQGCNRKRLGWLPRRAYDYGRVFTAGKEAWDDNR